MRSAAIHGQVLVAWEDQASDLGGLLQRLEASAEESVAHELRVAQGRFLFAVAERDVEAALQVSQAALLLLNLQVEPLARLAAMNLHSWGLVYSGKYEASLATSDRALLEAEEFGVDFVVGHAELAKANALIGQRRFTNAEQLLAHISRGLETDPDQWIVGNAALTHAFLQVSLGDLSRAADEVLLDPGPGQTGALWAEFHATRALIAAAAHSTTEALRWLALSEDCSKYVEAFAICSVTRAILATNAADIDQASHHIAVALSTGHRHSVVIGCRACPTMAQTLATRGELQNALRTIFSDSADVALAKASGLHMPRTRRTSANLSDRELEVYELLVQGRTNRQIAETLFIAESTTKVHVRHIFEKLGVRSRVEATRAWTASAGD
jgi:DNA-binding NarL/FixJ family response regulator